MNHRIEVAIKCPSRKALIDYIEALDKGLPYEKMSHAQQDVDDHLCEYHCASCNSLLKKLNK